jgi:Protein of unknown function (DUF1488)
MMRQTLITHVIDDFARLSAPAAAQTSSSQQERQTAMATGMRLSFPNRMRFYDTARGAVRFWAHDGAMESSFFVDVDSLKRLQPAMRFNENSILAAFDLNRAVIESVATKAYARSRKSSYDLVAADF